MVNELQRFPVLRKRMDEVMGNFLREGLEPSETMIGHIIEMEVWWNQNNLLTVDICSILVEIKTIASNYKNSPSKPEKGEK